MSPDELLSVAGMAPGECDLLAGGPPCQGFSVQRRGDDNDQRNNLVLRYLEFVDAIRPKFFLILPIHLQLACHINNPSHRHKDVYGRMSWDSPAPTLTARFDSFSRGRFGHPVEHRTITLREGARLQTFPDSFRFFGNREQVARQIGNAVPPLVAKALGETIRDCLADDAQQQPPQSDARPTADEAARGVS